MIGIDIVDLRQARLESNWRRKGYLQKIFTVGEIHLIRNAVDPELMVWLFWAMKESAYKIHSPLYQLRSYAPAALECTLTNATDRPKIYEKTYTFYGQVKYFGALYPIKAQADIENEYIQALAATDQNALEDTDVWLLDYDRTFNYKKLRPDSLSHHGRYLALAFGSENEG